MAPRSRKNIVSNFNVMVVGYSGVGKTSFIKTLLESLSLQHDDGPIEKTTQPYTITKEIQVDEKERILLTLIDTPGFNADFLVDKQLYDILRYIENQFDITLEEESKVKRNPKAMDTRVHCCLYFIDKPALDQVDIRILKKLTKRVNVIPVVGKADYLTLAQRNRIKKAIIRDLYNIPVYCMPEEEEEKKTETLDEFLTQFDYNEEDKETQSILDYLYTIPFTFFAYEDEPESGKPVRLGNIQLGRDYGWGMIDCLDEKYSDFTKLKDTLLSTHRSFLQLDTVERYYEQYRSERLLIKRAKHNRQ